MVEAIGRTTIDIYRGHREFLTLVLKTAASLLRPPFRIRQTIQQIHFVANQSVGIVVFCVSFAAMVVIIEAAFHMKLVIQTASMVPGFASLLILRELGSVLAALLITSRVGAGLTAEVGSMRVTEQVDALRMLGIDPVHFIVVPRFLACLFGGWLVAVISNIVCLLGAMLVSVVKLGFTPGTFIAATRAFVEFQDLIFASIKGACFGAVIPLISCYYGFRCQAGAQGVGEATTRSVVTTSITIIIMDFLLGWVFSHFY